MTTNNARRSAAMTTKANTAAQSNKKKPAYITRYVAVDSHLTERNGSTDSVFGLAGERPTGRKLAQDIASVCNQLDSDGYDIMAIIPMTSGRAVEATVEAAERVSGRTYTKRVPVQTEPSNSQSGSLQTYNPLTRYEDKHYVDTGAGYSVTDGVVITAKLRA